MMINVLIVEDSKDISLMLKESIDELGYCSTVVHTGIDGLKEIKKGIYSLVLLDIMLPYKSGDEILRETRAFSEVPIIIISAKDLIHTKIDLLKLGADDYITKPFDLGEVCARVESLLRRCKKESESPLNYTYKDMVVDTGIKEISVMGVPLDLTAKEYLIIELLIKHRDKVFTKANLYESIWQEEYLGDDNTIKTHMSNIRSKLKRANPSQNYIETVWGLGYRLYKI